MSGIGFGELIILFLIGLIVLGPERLPRVANQLGNWLGQARRMTRVMKRQLEEELDLNKPLEILPPDRTLHASRNDFGPASSGVPGPLNGPANAAPPEPAHGGASATDAAGKPAQEEPGEAQQPATDTGKRQGSE